MQTAESSIDAIIVRYSLWLLLILTTCPAAHSDTIDDQRMNVVFIVVDDLGWSDLGCCGSDFYQTSAIDEFSQTSLRFTQAYAAAPVCSPTRAAIMTGKHPARLDMTIWHEGAVGGGPDDRLLRDAPAQANLPRAETTLAEIFQAAGYFTAHLGKWHLGTAAYYPETQGYDLNIGGTFWGAPATFFFPYAGQFSQNDPRFRYVPGLAPGQEDDYLPDRLTDKALEIIESSRDEPFFLSLWYYTVHSPIEAPHDLVNAYRQKQPGQRHREPRYAAMVHRMDQNVGRVLQKLDELELTERTIVVFTSDNGGVDFPVRSIVPTSNLPLRSGKGTLYEGGLRVPLLIRWPGVTKPSECTQLTSSQDFLPTFAEYLEKSTVPISKPTGPLDGESLLPVLAEPTRKLNRDTLFWHFPHYYPRMTPGSALRQENWKLIHYYEDDRVELYDLGTDPGEERNVADSQGILTTQLRQQLDRWRDSVGANAPTVRLESD